MSPEQKVIQLQASLIHAMEFELVKRGVQSDISTIAKAISHRIKVEYMEEMGIKDFDEVESLFHNLEYTKTFRESMVLLRNKNNQHLIKELKDGG